MEVPLPAEDGGSFLIDGGEVCDVDVQQGEEQGTVWIRQMAVAVMG